MNSKWISAENGSHSDCFVFRKNFEIKKSVDCAVLKVSAKGVYSAELNAEKVGNFILAPGWTEYSKRIQVQEYDVTKLLTKSNNNFDIVLNGGWFSGRIASGLDCWRTPDPDEKNWQEALTAEMTITYCDGETETIITDESWIYGTGKLKFSDIYDGEIYDANAEFEPLGNAVLSKEQNNDILIEQQGEIVCEYERIKPIKFIETPKGEKVIDFGQNLSGYPEINIVTKKGERISFSFAEILDKDGNFYNENYRSAKCLFDYTCCDGQNVHKPTHTFYGFRYIRVDEFPTNKLTPESVCAVVIHSKMKRTGFFESSDSLLNRLFENIVWGQRSNYLEVPTDCPQRDERFGYTGDCQVFIRTASYNFDIYRFMYKWLEDLKLVQGEKGDVPAIAPMLYKCDIASAGWGDAVCICPWELYLTYGKKEILELMYPAMIKWIDYIASVCDENGIWKNHFQFGDWLELGNPEKGVPYSRKELVATAFYANSLNITCKAGRVLGKDTEKLEQLYKKVKRDFKREYKEEFFTQTELVLALHFGLAENPEKSAKKLHDMIVSDGIMMRTGFLGTPYILHVLTQYGYTELAYKLLMRKEYPSWLYPVTKGATTMWEHWDGIMPDGTLKDKGMNSYNHYAYGAVGDWLYEKCAGINRSEEHPGFSEVLFTPHATNELKCVSASIETAYGMVKSSWENREKETVYRFVCPTLSKAVIDGKQYDLKIGENILTIKKGCQK